MAEKLYRFKYENELHREALIMAAIEHFFENEIYDYEHFKTFPFLIEDMKTMYVLFSDDPHRQLTTEYRTWEEKEVLDWPTRKLEPFDFDIENSGLNLDLKWFEDEVFHVLSSITSQAWSTITELDESGDLKDITPEGAHKGRGGATIELTGNRKVEIILNFMDLYDITFINNGNVTAKVKDVYFDYLDLPLLKEINEFLVTKY